VSKWKILVVFFYNSNLDTKCSFKLTKDISKTLNMLHTSECSKRFSDFML